ncbi:hypothetical protein RHMOL_Rhmol04G0205300 [Rhododendron molle]|uniref:Uncharacterized protein n=1 Tax=Rhododendron molle TaxID=49168 RepID=A0ACC0P2Z1_RHOML|nr:hypothetical protein RHMOL_Rhmol04G0205300 [Rhododendron molle]
MVGAGVGATTGGRCVGGGYFGPEDQMCCGSVRLSHRRWSAFVLSNSSDDGDHRGDEGRANPRKEEMASLFFWSTVLISNGLGMGLRSRVGRREPEIGRRTTTLGMDGSEKQPSSPVFSRPSSMASSSLTSVVSVAPQKGKVGYMVLWLVCEKKGEGSSREEELKDRMGYQTLICFS